MKILQIHNYYQIRGGEASVVETEKELLEQNGHQVLQLLAYNKGLYKLPFVKKVFYKKLEEILTTNNIDVAHIHNVFQIIGPKVYKILYNYNIPIIQTLHNFRFLCPNGLFFDNNHNICELCKNGDFNKCVLKKCYQKSYLKSFLMAARVKKTRKYVENYVSQFIALTDFAKAKFIESGFVNDKIAVKPNFLFLNNNPNYHDKKYSLYLGRISEEKGLDVLIEAFKKVNFILKIAGIGNYLTTLKNKAKEYSNIKFIGFLSGKEKQKILKNCSFMVLPSKLYESFPISILEAYQYHKAVIASNLGGIPNIVRNNYSGYIFENGKIESLVETIHKILENERYKQFGENAFQLFKEKYTQTQNYKILMSVYKNVVKEEIHP